PSGPDVIRLATLLLGIMYFVTAPVVVMRQIAESVNHRAPSGPDVIPPEMLAAVGMGNSVIAPATVTRPILWPLISANHTAPSGPTVMPSGRAPGVGMGNSVTTPAVVIRATLF